MNRSWLNDLIGVQIMGVKIYETLTHWFQYMLHVWQGSRPLEWTNSVKNQIHYYVTRTTVELLAAQSKEQKCLEVLARAKSSSRVVRNFTTASGSLVAHFYSAHTRTFSPSLSLTHTWHPTPVRANVLRNSQNDSAATDPHSPRGLGSGEAGKAVTRCEENGFDKKLVEKVLNKSTHSSLFHEPTAGLKVILPNLKAFSANKTVSAHKKSNTTLCASWFGGLLSHGAAKYLGSACLGFAETQPAVVETPIMGKSWKLTVTMTCYSRAQG